MARSGFHAPFLLVLSGRETERFPLRSELLSIPHRELRLVPWTLAEARS